MKKRIRSAATAVLVAAASSATLAGCTGDSDEIVECEELLENTTLSVEDVDAADFTCRRNFGDHGERGTITLAVDTQRAATPVIEDVYRALASEPDIGSSWVVYVDFISLTGTSFNIEALDFNGNPPMDQIRDRYDIHPPGTD